MSEQSKKENNTEGATSPNSKPLDRRKFLKKAAYVAPAIITVCGIIDASNVFADYYDVTYTKKYQVWTNYVVAAGE
jgi:hypothetical protein